MVSWLVLAKVSCIFFPPLVLLAGLEDICLHFLRFISLLFLLLIFVISFFCFAMTFLSVSSLRYVKKTKKRESLDKIGVGTDSMTA